MFPYPRATPTVKLQNCLVNGNMRQYVCLWDVTSEDSRDSRLRGTAPHPSTGHLGLTWTFTKHMPHFQATQRRHILLLINALDHILL